MAAVLVGLVFGAGMALAAAGWSRHGRSERFPLPLTATACLALILILAVNVAALWEHSFWLSILIWMAIAAGGWVLRAGRSSRPEDNRGRASAPEVLVMVLIGVGLALPMLSFPVPFDTDAQGFGYLALTIREGGSLSTLAPWHPEISYVYSPGALVVFASLSRLLPQVPMSSVMTGATGAAAFGFVWLAWEFGREIGLQEDGGARPDKNSPGNVHRWRWAAGLSAALSIGLWTAFLDSHFSAIFGLLFALGCVTSLLRYKRAGQRIDAALSALFLAGVAATQPDITVAIGLGLTAFIIASFLGVDRPDPSRLLVLAAIPIAAAVLVSPWLVRLRPLLQSGVRSPFAIDPFFGQVLIFYHGGVGPLLALAGAVLVIRRRVVWGLTMVFWWIAAVDVSALGVAERVFPALGETAFRFNFPFSLAWHAPIIPYLALTAAALVWAAERWSLPSPARWAAPFVCTSAVLVVAGVAFHQPLITSSRRHLHFQGSLSSANDVRAMLWLRDHTPAESRVLNYPGDYEGGRDWEAHWAPAISERDCIYFRWQPFFLSEDGRAESGAARAEQRAFLEFWRDPADPAHSDLLRAAGVDYVLVPESVGDPASLLTAWRWAPAALLPDTESPPADAPYLRLAFAAGGAQVFELLP